MSDLVIALYREAEHTVNPMYSRLQELLNNAAAEIERLTAELAETQLLTTRDDYAALEAERDALRASEMRLKAMLTEAIELADDGCWEWVGDADSTGWSVCRACGKADWKGHKSDCEHVATIYRLRAALRPAGERKHEFQRHTSTYYPCVFCGQDMLGTPDATCKGPPRPPSP